MPRPIYVEADGSFHIVLYVRQDDWSLSARSSCGSVQKHEERHGYAFPPFNPTIYTRVHAQRNPETHHPEFRTFDGRDAGIPPSGYGS